jgi:hypothetical protein
VGEVIYLSKLKNSAECAAIATFWEINKISRWLLAYEVTPNMETSINKQ